MLEQLKKIKAIDPQAMTLAQNKWNSIAKPLKSLGLLENAVMQIAGITGSATVDISKKVVLVLCADNGVVAQGVSQCGQEVTAVVANNMAKGETCVCHMANLANAKVIPIDMGCAVPISALRNCAVRRGTGDITCELAMTYDETLRAIQTGISLVKEQKEGGVNLIATGEMGIGNTTTSTAVLSVLLGKNPDILTGVGAGLSQEGLLRKKQAISRAISLHQPSPEDVIDLLSKVGGLDLAGLCGVFLGGALYQVPIVIDGLISATAALCATKLAPLAQNYMLPSHQSKEIASGFALSALGLTPLIHGEMALGEGTGAVALFPLLDMAVCVYEKMSSFQDIGVDAYETFQ